MQKVDKKTTFISYRPNIIIINSRTKVDNKYQKFQVVLSEFWTFVLNLNEEDKSRWAQFNLSINL